MKKNQKNDNKKIDGKSKNLLINMATRNLWRNKPRTILTMLAITLVGIMFILNLGAKSLLKEYGRGDNRWFMVNVIWKC